MEKTGEEMADTMDVVEKKVTKEEIQDHIDKLIAQESANPSRRRSTN